MVTRYRGKSAAGFVRYRASRVSLFYLPSTHSDPDLKPEFPIDGAEQLNSKQQDSVAEDDDIPLNEDSLQSLLSHLYRAAVSDMWLTA